MVSAFNDLLALFGITLAAPSNLGELFPYLLTVCCCIGFTLFVLKWVQSFANRWYRW